jgi:D-xylose transport system ATP-binding protein
VETLLEILRRLRAQGTACIYISHKLDEVFAIADRITVLRDGATVTSFAARDANLPTVIRHMVGREITELFPRKPPAAPGDVQLRVRDLAVAPTKGAPAFLEGISFDLRRGEVLGFGGLMGAGRTELLMHLFGAWGHRLRGTVEIGGISHAKPTPRSSIARGMVLVSEDRKRYGLVLEQSIGFNLSLSGLGAVSAGGLVNGEREFVRNQEIFNVLRIKAPNLEAIAGRLSGGNQQKVVLGKAMLTSPRVVFLDEPTRGIDVGSKVEVYELINRLTAAGVAVVLVSSELPELMGMSDRILMLHEGTVGGTFARSDATQERLLAAAIGQSI